MKQFQSKLDELRNAIRMYVAAWGLTKVVLVIAIGLWVAFFLDYFPVFFGLRESPWISRLVVLLLLSSAVLYCLHRFLIRNLRIKVDDNSLKLLIERSHPELNDRLLTTSVEAKNNEHELSSRQQEMLKDLENEIQDQVSEIRPLEILAYRPLIRTGLIAVLPVIAMIISLVTTPELIWTGLRRNLLLAEIEYPRRTQIVSVSFRILSSNPRLDSVFPGERKLLNSGDQLLIAKGASIDLAVELKSKIEDKSESLPNSCRLIYELDNGQKGDLPLSRKQRMKDGLQIYSTQDGILKAIESPGEFWIVADDAVSRRIPVLVVDPPIHSAISTNLSYPKYLVENSVYENGQVEFVNESRYPEETEIRFHLDFESSGLTDFRIWNNDNGNLIKVDNPDLKSNSIAFSLKVKERNNLGIAVKDHDGIISQDPIILALDVIKDNPPVVNVVPVGIGQAVTRNAVIPIRVEAADEFGVKNGVLEITTSKSTEDLIEQPFAWNSQPEKTIMVDLLQLWRDSLIDLTKGDNSKECVIKVSTRVFDHKPGRQASEGQAYDFTIVDEKKLVQIIEREEAGLRKRLEEVAVEFGKTRALCIAVAREIESLDLKNDQSFDALMENAPVFVQRTRLQAQKSEREIKSIANSLLDLIDQLRNNRMTVKIKQLELSSKVEKPLRDFATIKLGEFQVDLVQLGESFKTFPADRTPETQKAILTQAKDILDYQAKLLIELNTIILQMVKFESQSELLESVRNLIEMHQEIMKETMNERQRKIFDGILD